MMTLTDVQVAAALSEQVYRRDDFDQQLQLASIGATDKSDAVGEVIGFDLVDGYYYNDSTGFVGHVVELR